MQFEKCNCFTHHFDYLEHMTCPGCLKGLFTTINETCNPQSLLIITKIRSCFSLRNVLGRSLLNSARIVSHLADKLLRKGAKWIVTFKNDWSIPSPEMRRRPYRSVSLLYWERQKLEVCLWHPWWDSCLLLLKVYEIWRCHWPWARQSSCYRTHLWYNTLRKPGGLREKLLLPPYLEALWFTEQADLHTLNWILDFESVCNRLDKWPLRLSEM